MSTLTEVLGKHIDSAEVRFLRNAFPYLTAAVLDLAPDEGMPKDYFLSSPSEGISIKHTAAGQIEVVFLMGEGKDGYSQFAGELPEGLSFADSPDHVRKVLGPPGFERQASHRPFAHGEIVRYNRLGYSLHIQFRGSGIGIELITLMCDSPKTPVNA